MNRYIQVRTESRRIVLNEFYESLSAMIPLENIKSKKDSEELTIETEFEQESHRWIAEVIELSGVLVYGQTEEDAINKAKVLALRVLADQLEHGEISLGLGRLFRLRATSSNKILAS